MLNPSVLPDATGLSSIVANLAKAHSYDEYVPTVIFRLDNPTGGTERLTAVFPCEPAEGGLMLAYSEGEGPVPCSRLWFDMSRAAPNARSHALAERLAVALGCKLDIRHRITPAMDATRAFRAGERMENVRASLLEERTTKAQAGDGVRLTGSYHHPAIKADMSACFPRLEVVYREAPGRPGEPVIVFPHILPDEPGQLGYTVAGVALLTDEWVAASIPAKAGSAKARRIAAALRNQSGARLFVLEDLTEDSRRAAESRRNGRHGALGVNRHTLPLVEMGKAYGVTAKCRYPTEAAIYIAATALGLTTGQIAAATGAGWIATHETIENMRRRVGRSASLAVEMAEYAFALKSTPTAIAA